MNENPWLIEDMQGDDPGTQTCDVHDRVAQIRQCTACAEDINWLCRVVLYGWGLGRNQKTVQEAAESKLRVLQKRVGI